MDSPNQGALPGLKVDAPRSPANGGSGQSRLDVATILGYAFAFALIAFAVAANGSIVAFLDARSILIVIGGTIAVTIVSFSGSDLGAAYGALGRALLNRNVDAATEAYRVIRIADKSRREPAKNLEQQLRRVKDAPFLYKALSLVVDGLPADDVEKLLRQELMAMSIRHAASIRVFQRAAEVAPAMGLIGTLIGLVHMLTNLNEPSTIGPAMAMALLTTFYGAVLGNMVLAPMAAKLERNSREELDLLSIYAAGAVSIARQDNPRRLELVINSALSPLHRTEYFK